MKKSQQIFAEYTSEITEKFLSKYERSYSDPKQIKNTWRTQNDYSLSAENDLILWTIVFIALLPETDGLAKNPYFIKNIVSRTADYLSKYMAKNPQFADRNQAKKSITERLYDSSYLRGVFKNKPIITNNQHTR